MKTKETMAKKQTRRSISVKGKIYARWKGWCESQGSSMSGRLEKAMEAEMDAGGAPEVLVTPLTVPAPVTLKPSPMTPPKEGVYKDLGDEVFS
jgi:hypothetical protein